ncbi:MAG: hypothetical protein QF659_07700 [Dehalococcoidia bacterium]|nr:hypothetical protein [Dehalococcoidia bacterium]
MRRVLFISTLIVGLALAVAGFALSAPIGANTGPDFSNPRLDFALAMFIIGIILTFSSAVVYEVLPNNHGK